MYSPEELKRFAEVDQKIKKKFKEKKLREVAGDSFFAENIAKQSEPVITKLDALQKALPAIGAAPPADPLLLEGVENKRGLVESAGFSNTEKMVGELVNEMDLSEKAETLGIDEESFAELSKDMTPLNNRSVEILEELDDDDLDDSVLTIKAPPELSEAQIKRRQEFVDRMGSYNSNRSSYEIRYTTEGDLVIGPKRKGSNNLKEISVPALSYDRIIYFLQNGKEVGPLTEVQFDLFTLPANAFQTKYMITVRSSVNSKIKPEDYILYVQVMKYCGVPEGFNFKMKKGIEFWKNTAEKGSVASPVKEGVKGKKTHDLFSLSPENFREHELKHLDIIRDQIQSIEQMISNIKEKSAEKDAMYILGIQKLQILKNDGIIDQGVYSGFQKKLEKAYRTTKH
jgi:hypothetical protein